MKPVFSRQTDEHPVESSPNWQAYSVALILMTSLMAASIWAVHGGLG